MEPLEVIEGERSETRLPIGGPASRFPLVPFEQIQPSFERRYLVQGLIPMTALVVIWGAYKSGKSFFVFDMMMHVALGRPYRGRAVVQGPVVYCALEGVSGFRARVAAFRKAHALADDEAQPFFLMGMPLNLADDVADLIEAIRAQLGDQIPVVVVFDTLNRSFKGSESNDEHMGDFVRAADAVRLAFGCTVIIIHHSGVNPDRPRGHTSLTAAADAQLSITRRKKDQVILAEVEWMKDGPEGDQILNRLDPVAIGLDANGEPVTSCIVVPVEGEYQPPASPKLSDAAKKAFAVLEQIAATNGVPAKEDEPFPAGTPCVGEEEWRQACYSAGISTSLDARAKQLGFKRGKDKLAELGLVQISNGRVCIASPDSNECSR